MMHGPINIRLYTLLWHRVSTYFGLLQVVNVRILRVLCIQYEQDYAKWVFSKLRIAPSPMTPDRCVTYDLHHHVHGGLGVFPVP